MTTSAKMITDSASPDAIRLMSMELRYPKFIHGEAKTHRLINISDKAYELLNEVGFMDDKNLSRNASSLRAIPVNRLIDEVMTDPAMPVYWGKNRPGMQATEEMTEQEADHAKYTWLRARDHAVAYARMLADRGAHKQIVNRIIEPWCHIKVVVTATDWRNFFALRCHPGAQPEMRELADKVVEAQRTSTPRKIQQGEWHLPYIDPVEFFQTRIALAVLRHGQQTVLTDKVVSSVADKEVYEQLVKYSVARCARVSYNNHDGSTPNPGLDVKLYDSLVGSTPLHASPAEHQATPDRNGAVGSAGQYQWAMPWQHGNLFGWRQYRKMLINESATEPRR